MDNSYYANSQAVSRQSEDRLGEENERWKDPSPQDLVSYLTFPLAQGPGFAILSARLRTLVKQRSVRRMLAPGSQKEGQLEKHLRWKPQLQYR